MPSIASMGRTIITGEYGFNLQPAYGNLRPYPDYQVSSRPTKPMENTKNNTQGL
jgi:hypothetical protein